MKIDPAATVRKMMRPLYEISLDLDVHTTHLDEITWWNFREVCESATTNNLVNDIVKVAKIVLEE